MFDADPVVFRWKLIFCTFSKTIDENWKHKVNSGQNAKIQKNKVTLTNDQDISSITCNLEKNLEQKFLNEMLV